MARIDGPATVLCLTGPESTGKTTLAKQLADHLSAPWVAEEARGYFARSSSIKPGHQYDHDDVLAIARRQLAAEQQAFEQCMGSPVVLDTDLSVIVVWFAERFGGSDPWLDEQWRTLSPRSYLLLHPDLPWEPDPLRENPTDRHRLFDRYVELLESSVHPYAVVSGEGDDRLHNALHHVDQWLKG